MNMCKINPRVRIAFKKLFAREENKDLLLSLINSIVSEKDQVEEIEIKNPYNFDKGWFSFIYVQGKCVDKTMINIKIEVDDYYHCAKNSLSYFSNTLSEHLKDNSIYKPIHKTICINILNVKNYYQEDYHNVYEILNRKTNLNNEIHDVLEIHYFDLKDFSMNLNELKTTLDKWIYFFANSHSLDKHNLPEKLKENNEISKAIVEVDKMFDEEEREVYIDNRIGLMNRQSELDTAFENLNKEKARIEIATKILKKGLDIDLISEMSGLSQKEINNLKKNIKKGR